MGKTSEKAEALQFLKDLLLPESQGRFISDIWMQVFLTKHRYVIGLDTKALRTFLLHHPDVFQLDSNEKVTLCNTSTSIMASKMKPGSPKDQSAKKSDDLPYLKRHVGKKENEVLHALANLVCEKRSATQVLTMSQLAASMSMLSEEHHQIIGHGQKDLQKFLQKHGDIFTVQGGTVSIRSGIAQMLKYNEDLETPIITDDCLQQVLGTVTRVLEGYGFIITTNGYDVYFSANVFEGGNVQDLTNHIGVGDKVVLDAEKSGPTYAAKWRATKVRKLRRQYSSSRDSWSGSCSSLDKIEAVENRWVSLDSLSSDISKKSSSITQKKKDTEKLSLKDRELILFLQNRLRMKNNQLSIQNLTGHLSGLPAHLHTHISGKRDELRMYIEKHKVFFNLQGDVVSLKNVQILSEDDKDSQTSESSSSSNFSSDEIVPKVKTKVKGKVLSTDDSGSGIIILVTGEMVQFTSSFTSFGSKKPFHPSDTVVCNAVFDKEDWKATNVWHQTSPTSKTSFQIIEAPQVTGYRGKIIYVYPTYGIIRHGASDDENIYFRKDVVVSDYEVDSLGDILAIGDEVLCDAVKVTNYTCGYRALRVIPLDDKDDSFQVVSRKSAKTVPQSTDTAWSSLLKVPKASTVAVSGNHTGNPLEEVYVSDDEWDTNEDGDDERLVNCSGRVVSLKQNCGFIQRGKTQSFKDPENVYFNNLAFCAEGGVKVTNLLEVLNPGDVVYYDAVRGYDNASCKWRAEVVWKDGANRRADSTINGETLAESEGKIIKIYPSKGLISFGPHPYLDRVFFSKDVFYYDGLRRWNLATVLKHGDTVMFDAECDIAGEKTKWKASRVWVDDKSSNQQLTGPNAEAARNTDHSGEQYLHDREGRVVAVFPSKGVIMFGLRTYFEEVFFTVDVFYDNGCTVHNLQSVLKQDDIIKFDAALDRPEQRTKWKALLVWKGQRPNISSAARNQFLVRDFLQPFMPDLYKPNEAEDLNAEIINTRGQTIQQNTNTRGLTTLPVVSLPRRNSSDSEKSASSYSLVKAASEKSLSLNESAETNKIVQSTHLSKTNSFESSLLRKELSTATKTDDAATKLVVNFPDINETNREVAVTSSASSPAVMNYKITSDNTVADEKLQSESVHVAISSSSLETFEIGDVKEVVKCVTSTEQGVKMSGKAVSEKPSLDTVNELPLPVSSGGSLLSPATATGPHINVPDNEKVMIDSTDGRTGHIVALQNNFGYINTTVGEKDKFESVKIFFHMKIAFVNGVQASESSLTVGETVYLNAKKYLDVSSNSTQWEATMVWKGRKPRFLSVSSEGGTPLDGPASPASSVDNDLDVKHSRNMNKLLENSKSAESHINSVTSLVDSGKRSITPVLPQEANIVDPLLHAIQQGLPNKSNKTEEEKPYHCSASSDLHSDAVGSDAHFAIGSLPEDFTSEEDMALEEMISKEIEALVDPLVGDPRESTDPQNVSSDVNHSSVESSLGSNIPLSEKNVPESKELVPWDDDAPHESWISLDDATEKVNEISADKAFEENEHNFDLERKKISELDEGITDSTDEPETKANLTRAEGLHSSTSADLMALNDQLIRSLWPSRCDRRDSNPGVPENIPSFPTQSSTDQPLADLSGSVDFSHLWMPSQVSTATVRSLQGSERADQTEVERAWLECFDLLRYLHSKTKEILQRTPSQSVVASNDSAHQTSVVNASNQEVLVVQPRTQTNTVTVATQTVFTGDVFCNTIYSGE